MSIQPGANDSRWVYKSPNLEIEIWAPTKLHVVSILIQHGFLNVDESKITLGRMTRPVPMSTDYEKVGIK